MEVKISEKVITLTHVPKNKGDLTPITIRFNDGKMIARSYKVPDLGRITRDYKGKWYLIQRDGEVKNWGTDKSLPFESQSISLTMHHMVEGAEDYLRTYEVDKDYEIYVYQAYLSTFVDFMFHAGEWTASVRVGKDTASDKNDVLKILWGKEFWRHESEECNLYYKAKGIVPEAQISDIMLRYLSMNYN